MKKFRLQFAAVGVAALTVSLADILFSLGRGSTLELFYFASCVALSITAYLLVAAVAGALKFSVETSLVICAGIEGLALQGPLSACTLVLGSAVAISFRTRKLGRLQTVSESASMGFIQGVSVAAIQILWVRMTFVMPLLEDPILSHALTGGILLAVILSVSTVYKQLRAHIKNRWNTVLSNALPSEQMAWAFAFIVLFAVLPAQFGESQDTLEYTTRSTSNSNKPNVLILVLDTVRADHLGVYGYDRDTTPKIGEFLKNEERSAIFPLAIASSPWTVPSHASLFSGFRVSDHGVHSGNRSEAFYYGSLPPTPTLAESLRESGYRTALIYANLFLGRIGGGTRGFEVSYVPPYVRNLTLAGESLRKLVLPNSFRQILKNGPNASSINAGILRFFDECGPGPCFVVANYMEAHGPLVPRIEYEGHFASMPTRPGETRPVSSRVFEAAYDEEILGLDERIGELLSALKHRGILDQTWLFITSDHGEALTEHGDYCGHGQDVYNPEVHIPLIVVPPMGESMAVTTDAVGLIDITATVAAIGTGSVLGQGIDLRRPFNKSQPQWVELFEIGNPDTPLAQAVVQSQMKLITRLDGTTELYRLDDDPREVNNISDSNRELCETLRAMKPSQKDFSPAFPRTSPTKPGISKDLAETLRALGYAE